LKDLGRCFFQSIP